MHASSESRFPNEGWYSCFIRRFQLNKEDAAAYQIQRRNFPPGLYNARRLREKGAKPHTEQCGSTLLPTLFQLHSSATESHAVRATPSISPVASPNLGTDTTPAQSGDTHTDNLAENSQQYGLVQNLARNLAENLVLPDSLAQDLFSIENVASTSPSLASAALNSETNSVLGSGDMPLNTECSEQSGLVRNSVGNLVLPESLAQDLFSIENVASASQNPAQNSTVIATQGPSILSSSNSVVQTSSISHYRRHSMIPDCPSLGPSTSLIQNKVPTRRLSDPSPSTSQEHYLKTESEPIFSLYNVNTRSLADILSTTLNSASFRQDENDSSNDCEMIGENVPRPLESTSEGLIKKDGDTISNDKPFITSKNGRVYKIGDRLIEIHNDVVNNLLQWNTDSQRDDPDIDYAFGLSLLLSLISVEHIAAGQIDNNALAFVLDLLRLRAMNDEARVERVAALIKKYCEEKRV